MADTKAAGRMAHFAVEFGTALIKVKKAAKANRSVTLSPQEATAILDGVKLMAQRVKEEPYG
jgi:methylthioribose-1-phosphate isomerase